MSTPAQLRASEKYKKKNIKRVALDMQKTYFEEVLKPEATRLGETVNGYIKKAIALRMEMDNEDRD